MPAALAPGRDLALPSDVRDLFSWLSLGAAIENLVLAAGLEGLAAEVEYERYPFPLIRGDELVARVRITAEPAPADDDLASSIENRCTNRKPYDRAPLDAGTLDRLGASIADDTSSLAWLTHAADKQRLAQLVVVADRVRFESRPFHEEFHAVLRYTRQEAEAARDGLDVRTFEAPPGTGLILRCLRSWRRMQLANRFGMSRAMAETSRKLVVYSGAIGLLCAASDHDESFLQAGRAFERIWLAATRDGLAFQPLGALPLFLYRLQVLRDRSFPSAHLAVMRGVRTPFEQLFPTDEGVPVMLFRIGRAPAPSARSLRYAPGALIVRN